MCFFFFKSPAPPNTCGKLLISGATNWDLVGRKETPKSAGKFVFHETLILVNRLPRGLSATQSVLSKPKPRKLITVCFKMT